jgi:N-methylhydantoinase A/oxoprolinase/acetone carboxylase beta subunit
MKIALGIDTGGTYTDAALVDLEAGKVLASAKALTTYRDLSVGISGAVDRLFAGDQAVPAGQISLVGLSTTLATNAIVESRHGRACLILIGYDRELLDRYKLRDRLVVDDVVFVAGGHDAQGEEAAPLDEEAIRRAVAQRPGVEAFAVSGYFSVRNPEHELKAKELIESVSGKAVTCGHELSQRLDSVTRATTTALNATLIPIIKELIAKVRQSLSSHGLESRLMVVKGDGSLVDAKWAAKRPVETVLSGPAASVVGAAHLAGLDRGGHGGLWVLDMGGTTSDMALIENGRPVLNQEGADVGGWRTLVEAVEVRTVGLGGDSQVAIRSQGGFEIRPRRVVPVCRLASEFPGMLPELKRQARSRVVHDRVAVFLTQARSAPPGLQAWESQLVGQLNQGPLSWDLLVTQAGPASYLPMMVDQAASRRLILLAGFTPTDALHALGRLDLWDQEASRLAAKAMARLLGMDYEEFCETVLQGFVQKLSQEILASALSHEGLELDEKNDPVANWLIRRALNGHGPNSQGIGVKIRLGSALVAVGAPVETYAPPAAKRLEAPLTLPPHAEVANAVGAVVGGVLIKHTVLIKPDQETGVFRLHLPHGVEDFLELDEAVARAEAVMEPVLLEEARKAGTAAPNLSMERIDQEVNLGVSYEESLYLGSELVFRVSGRPAPV